MNPIYWKANNVCTVHNTHIHTYLHDIFANNKRRNWALSLNQCCLTSTQFDSVLSEEQHSAEISAELLGLSLTQCCLNSAQLDSVLSEQQRCLESTQLDSALSGYHFALLGVVWTALSLTLLSWAALNLYSFSLELCLLFFNLYKNIKINSILFKIMMWYV